MPVMVGTLSSLCSASRHRGTLRAWRRLLLWWVHLPNLTSSFCVSGKFQCELNSPSRFLFHYFQTRVQKRVKDVKNVKDKDTSPTASLLSTHPSKCVEQFNIPSGDASSGSPRVPDSAGKCPSHSMPWRLGLRGQQVSLLPKTPGDPKEVMFLLCV